MSKTFQLVDTPAHSTSFQHSIVTNWKLCVICQEEKGEPLTCPSKSKRKDVGSGYSYSSLAENLVKFNELGQLPIQLEELDINECHGIEMALIAKNAQYHQSCRLKYNSTDLRRAEKRFLMTGSEGNEVNACKRKSSRNPEIGVEKDVFFSGDNLQALVASMIQPHSK